MIYLILRKGNDELILPCESLRFVNISEKDMTITRYYHNWSYDYKIKENFDSYTYLIGGE